MKFEISSFFDQGFFPQYLFHNDRSFLMFLNCNYCVNPTFHDFYFFQISTVQKLSARARRASQPQQQLQLRRDWWKLTQHSVYFWLLGCRQFFPELKSELSNLYITIQFLTWLVLFIAKYVDQTFLTQYGIEKSQKIGCLAEISGLAIQFLFKSSFRNHP